MTLDDIDWEAGHLMVHGKGDGGTGKRGQNGRKKGAGVRLRDGRVRQ